jgi:hypothetical protein
VHCRQHATDRWYESEDSNCEEPGNRNDRVGWSPAHGHHHHKYRKPCDCEYLNPQPRQIPKRLNMPADSRASFPRG